MTTEDKGQRAARLVPEFTKENHLDDLRHAAEVRGISAAEARDQKVGQWRVHHEVDPTAGWDLLADWLDSVQLEASAKADVPEKAVDRAPRTTRAKKTA